MIRKTAFLLIFAAGLTGAIATFEFGWPKPVSASVADTELGQQLRPRYVNMNTLDRCFVEPFECGLVVW